MAVSFILQATIILTSLHELFCWTQTKNGRCVPLEPVFKYSQEDSPKDISAVIAIMTNKVNRELTRVTKIEVRQDDQSQSFPLGMVGEHLMIATVRRIDEYHQEEELCFHVKFEITDVDECKLPVSHPMASRCHYTVECVNTQGSYECRCPLGAHGLSGTGAGMGQCDGAVDTACCMEGTQMNRRDVQTCKAAFRCTTDKCPGDCVPEATCMNSKDGNTFTCRCRPPYIGDGHRCIGPEPTVWVSKLGSLITKNSPDSCAPSVHCGCTLPKVDHCHEVNCGANAYCVNTESRHQCICNTGFKLIEGLGCTTTKVPTLKLKGPIHITLHQCDSYEEFGVDIIDLNEESMSRNVEIEYSEPLGSCMRKIGGFHVNYTLQTPWAQVPFIRATRFVDVSDVDECSLSERILSQCPDCRPQCSPEASCSNTVGSYTCNCPPCMEGDGFISLCERYSSATAPHGYVAGTGCVDICAPVITLPEPFVFRVPKSYGLEGPLEHSLCQHNYEQELNSLLQQTNGKVLCTIGEACVNATDDNGLQIIDVTDKVTIGRAIALPSKNKDEYLFQVPYDVTDAVGNHAATTYRKVIVQVKTLDEVEQECRDKCNKGTLECPRYQCTEKYCQDCNCAQCPRTAAKEEKTCKDPVHVQPTAFGIRDFLRGYLHLLMWVVSTLAAVLTVLLLIYTYQQLSGKQ